MRSWREGGEMAQAFSIESGNHQDFDRAGAYSWEELATLLPLRSQELE